MDKSKVAIDPKISAPEPMVVVSKSEQKSDKAEEKDIPLASFIDAPVNVVRKIFNFFFDFLETTVVALSIFVVIYLVFAQPHEIRGDSMVPNFQNKQFILTDKFSYRFNNPKRGDVVIFKAPDNPEVDYIKRVIGLPGEKIKIEGGYVYTNGSRLDEPYLRSITLVPGTFIKEGVEIEIPPNQYFVMGDNRPHSSDSRQFGPIAFNVIIGKAFLRYWPLSDLGIIQNNFY